MRIAWFSPLSEKSAIGRASTYIVRELAKGVDVEFWHFDKGPLHPVREAKLVYAPSADLCRLAIPTKPNTIPEASRTGFRSEVEQRSERSDAGILIVE